ncbi:glycerol dehydrogenase [Sporolactobacillus inulinus CASD]|uniref:Glycerol dehydrogenase n=2 Tax=Sporolactobacillus inulinus TaxID=2078 RepID=A0A0U1QRB2_9BACL|nr:glycerol dehydrogenase [Sporolactobacillus inulinus CASD]GEB78010.1 glycerol dehydrogenase [Sporolactobacillus inulinus]
MEKVFVSPSRYVQGKDVFKKADQYVKKLGDLALVVADETVWKAAAEAFSAQLKKGGIEVVKEVFQGECSINEINRLTESGKAKKVNVVIGLGGGKTLDTVKAVADHLDTPVVCAPTVASADAPTAGLSVIYTDDGAFESYLFYDKNPELVIVDTRIIAESPHRMLVSGISDALATWIEARAVAEGHNNTMSGKQPTLAGKAIAETCEKVLFDYALPAIEANQKKIVTPALEAIVEANTLLSGLGFEDGGLGAAHAIHNGFTALTGDIHHLTHGEKVAYGALTQLVLENKPFDELERYIGFYLKLGLPTSLKEIHLEKATDEELYKVGEKATAPGETIHQMPFAITADDVVQAIKGVDAYVKDYKSRHGWSVESKKELLAMD